MDSIRQNFSVVFGYPVTFTEKVFDSGNPALASAVSCWEDGRREDGGPRKVLCVIDRGVCERRPDLARQVEAYCLAYPNLTLVRPPMILPGGESVKNTHQYVHQVQEAISEFGLCRHSFVLAVGGGALLDMAGYAAATAHRGVQLIRLPTTVLAQNDSGIGVKNGINAFGKKNFLGVFAPPHAVINDFGFLSTLSDRDWRSGIAEAVKVALIRDAAFFEFLEEHVQGLANRELAPMRTLIHRCAELHLNHIAKAGDPFEAGSSRPLDFGHWAAHKLEQMTNFRLRHGEAVAIGMALDVTYSCLAGLLAEPDCRRILDFLEGVGFSLHVPEMEGSLSRSDPKSLLHGLTEFREHLGGRLTITLLSGIGRGVEVHHMDDEKIRESIAALALAAEEAHQPAV
jgi:3-dehydroquinate synthase